jgi:hypothetical protein
MLINDWRKKDMELSLQHGRCGYTMTEPVTGWSIEVIDSRHTSAPLPSRWWKWNVLTSPENRKKGREDGASAAVVPFAPRSDSSSRKSSGI